MNLFFENSINKSPSQNEGALILKIDAYDKSTDRYEQSAYGCADSGGSKNHDRVHCRGLQPQGQASSNRSLVHAQGDKGFSAAVEVFGQTCQHADHTLSSKERNTSNRVANSPRLNQRKTLATCASAVGVGLFLFASMTFGQTTAQLPAEQPKISSMQEAVAAARRITDSFKTELEKKFPQTQGSTVEHAFAGFYKVSKGAEVGFISEDLRYLIRGEVFDLEKGTFIGQAQFNLNGTNPPPPVPAVAPAKVDVSTLPTSDAIRIGTGSRWMYVFSDPDCPFCKQYEQVLAKTPDVSVFIFPFPLEQLHPQAKKISTAIWCRDPAQRETAWRSYLLQGQMPAKMQLKNCATPIERNLQLGARIGVNGTPATVFADGTIQMGAMDAKRLQFFLARSQEASGDKK